MWASQVQEMRPRSERRPIVYGRVQYSGVDDEKAARPLETLRKWTSERELGRAGAAGRGSGGSGGAGVDLSDVPGAVLLSEGDRTPFGRPRTKGSFQLLRETLSTQGIVNSKGAFQHLSKVFNEERQQQQQEQKQQQQQQQQQQAKQFPLMNSVNSNPNIELASKVAQLNRSK